MKRLMTLLLIAFIFPSLASAQEKDKKNNHPTLIVEVIRGSGNQGSYFYPPGQDIRKVDVLSISADTRNSNDSSGWIISGGAKLISKTGKEFDISARGQFLSVGPVHLDFGMSYFYSNAHSDLFASDSLDLNGQTQKHSGFLSAGGGIGSYKQSHARISFIAGGLYIKNSLYIHSNNELSNPYNNLFGEDVLVVKGGELILSLRLFNRLVVESTKRYIRTGLNKQGMIPDEQILISGKVNFFIYRNFGISIKGSYGSDPLGPHLLARSIEAGLALKF